MRIGVLINPTAGRGRAAAVGVSVITMLRQAGHDPVDLTGPDADAARRGAEAFLNAGAADLLVAVGGDGVVNLAVNTLMESTPEVPLGLVPCGSGNDTARSLGLPQHDWLASTQLLLDRLTRPADLVDVGRITPQEPEIPPHWFVNIASAGIDAAVNSRANALHWRHNSSRYVIALAWELIAFRGYNVRVIADGVDCGDTGTLVAVAGARYFGGGMQIAPDADWTDGLFDVVTARTVSRATVATVFPRIYRGTHLSHPAVSVRQAREVLLLPDDNPARRPAPMLHADGEPIIPLPVRIAVEPGRLALLS